MATAEQLLNSRVIDEAGCWIFIGSFDRYGYGRIGHDGKTRGAHRVAYAVFVQPIPDGMTVDHVCFNTTCINPSHLRLLSFGDNSARQRKALSDFCQRGHEFTPDNTAWQKNRRDVGRADVYRLCRACRRLADRRRRSSFRAAA